MMPRRTLLLLFNFILNAGLILALWTLVNLPSNLRLGITVYLIFEAAFLAFWISNRVRN